MALDRSAQMSRIRGSDTSPERLLRALLEARGLHHDVGSKAPVGKPDMILRLSVGPLAVFVDGCFWHGCPLHYARPRTRPEFWAQKLVTNIERDARFSAALTDAGWRVVRVWEHEVVEDAERVADHIEQVARGDVTPGWPAQRRVRSVAEIADRVERREVVILAEPAKVIETSEGPRVTAKARARKSASVPRSSKSTPD